jgi:hypothetical protein
MLRRYTLLALMLAAGVLFAALPSGAADKDEKKESEAETKAAGKATLIVDLITANRMAEFGREHKAPEALVAAGSLLRQAATRANEGLGVLGEKPIDENGKEIKEEPKKSADLKDQARDLFDEARAMASGDKAMMAVIKEAETREYKTRDVFGGPKRVERAINPGQVHVYHIPFITNLPASVGLTSQGSTLHFQIKAGDAELFAVRGNYANYNWTPKGGPTKTFTVVIHNVGGKGSVYTLLAN